VGQVLHGSAHTTEAVRRAIQRSEASVRALAKRHGISPTTVQKWRKRATVADAPMGPKPVRSTVLTVEEEAMVMAVSTSHAVAAGRLSLRPPAHDSAPDALGAAPLPTTAWNQPVAGDGRRQAGEAEVQALSNRLLPHRHCRGANRGR